jgi:aerobic carbon-monoxide dehydrogenase small subunit
MGRDPGSDVVRVSITVNGQQHEDDVEPRLLLVHYLREVLGLTGTNVGCHTSSCGACSVHLDREAVKSCTVLAVQAEGARPARPGGQRLATPGISRRTATATRTRHDLPVPLV